MTTTNTEEIKIPALSLSQINQRFGANKNMVAFLHTDRKNNEYMFFIDSGSNAEEYVKIRNSLNDESQAWSNSILVYTRQAVPPRAGCLDGNINSFQKWKAVYARNAKLLTDPAEITALNDRDLNNRFPSLEEALMARLPEVSDLKAYLLENNILRNSASCLNYFLKSDVLIDDVLIFCLKLSKHFGDPETYWTNIHTANRLFILQTNEDVSNNLNKVIIL